MEKGVLIWNGGGALCVAKDVRGVERLGKKEEEEGERGKEVEGDGCSSGKKAEAKR